MVERVITPEAESRIWKLAEKAGRMFLPPAQRGTYPSPISGPCIVLGGPHGYPHEYTLAVTLNDLTSMGELCDKPDTLKEVINFGLSSAPGEKKVIPGTEFPKHNFFYYMLRIQGGLVVQPYEKYQRWDQTTRKVVETKDIASYPVVLREDELPHLKRFFSDEEVLKHGLEGNLRASPLVLSPPKD